MTSSSASRFAGIAEELRSEIFRGDYDRGDNPFPSVRLIAERFGVSPPTASRAIGLLTEEGLLIARKNQAPLVAHPDSRVGVRWTVTNRYAKARAAQGLIFATDVQGDIVKETIDREWISSNTRIAQLLDAPPRTRIFRRVSRTVIDGTPTEYTAMHFPRFVIDAAPELETASSIRVVPMIESGLGQQIEATENELRARPARENEAAMLDLAPGAHVFEATHATILDDGRRCEAVVNIKPVAGTVLTFTTYEGELK